MDFQPPPADERLQAIGPLADLPDTLRRFFEPGSHFDPIPAPGPQDWLAHHPEPGQTFARFVRSRPNRPDARRHRLYLQPLGEFAEGKSPSLDLLGQFAAAFFCMSVRVLPGVSMGEGKITSRRNPYTRNLQLLTGDILRLLQQRLPADAYALLGITMADLYPEPSWNFVFGQASLRHRAGVYSFARYDPHFYGESASEGRRQLLLQRGCKVLAHETTHMFGVEHCIYFHCLMNGSNHLAESDARPLHICPVDLRKLYASTGFDPVARYQRLLQVCERIGFGQEADWLWERLDFSSKPTPGR